MPLLQNGHIRGNISSIVKSMNKVASAVAVERLLIILNSHYVAKQHNKTDSPTKTYIKAGLLALPRPNWTGFAGSTLLPEDKRRGSCYQ